MSKYTNLNFSNKNNFDILVIKYSDINSLDWNDPLYLDKLLSLNNYTLVTTNNDTFMDNISTHLEINKYNEFCNVQVNTQIIAEFPNYIYELLYFVIFDKNNKLIQNKEILNSIATLLNTNGDQIFGNAIVMKTYLPFSSDEMILHNIEKINIKEILDNRINIQIVIFDDEWKQIKVSGDLEIFAKEFFDDTYLKLEIPFLLHNINIWYEVMDGCSPNLCGKILEKPIYKCLWFTMITDEYKGSLTLDEVTKIIKLSYYLEYPYQIKQDNKQEDNNLDNKQEDNKQEDKLIKNKYRILNSVFNQSIK